MSILDRFVVRWLACAASFWALCCVSPVLAGDCPEEPPFGNFDGAGEVVCPCFVPGEEAGVILAPPAGDLPIEVLRVGIAWGSQFGGAPQTLEDSINIYAAGLPNPGAPIASLGGPLLTDGFINEFDFEPLPGEVTISAVPFSTSLRFLNQNAGDIFAPSVVHDGNGCQVGANSIKAIPGGWLDACAVGLTGDWVMYVVYRPDCPTTGVGDERIVASAPAALLGARPNPFRQTTDIGFFIADPQRVSVAIYDVSGHHITTLADRDFAAGAHDLRWDGRDAAGREMARGVYMARMESRDFSETRKIVLQP